MYLIYFAFIKTVAINKDLDKLLSLKLLQSTEMWISLHQRHKIN